MLGPLMIVNDGSEIEHLCNDFDCESREIYACRHFGTEFDLLLAREPIVAHRNVTLARNDEHYFFYSTPPSKSSNNGGRGKDNEKLHKESIDCLEEFLNDQMKRLTHTVPLMGQSVQVRLE